VPVVLPPATSPPLAMTPPVPMPAVPAMPPLELFAPPLQAESATDRRIAASLKNEVVMDARLLDARRL
jgi:hypothetical protein